MILAGTGHRPKRLLVHGVPPYSGPAFDVLTSFATQELRRFRPATLISGMALGWDQALATAAVALNIPFHAYIAFEGVETRWPDASQDQFNALLARAELVRIVSPGGYSAAKLHRRNEAMVDASNHLAALWDGEPNGGTYRCVEYANQTNRDVTVLWSRWLRFLESI